ncbi:unnamed protein product, partial [Staurois parvus]
MNITQKWEFFKKTVCEHTAKYIPMGNKFKRLKIKPMWLTAKAIKATDNKKRAFIIYKNEGTLSSFKHYKE